MENLEAENVVILGDIHGSWGKLISLNDTIQNSIIIQVGDHGLVDERMLNKLNNFSQKNGNRILVIRGNHDDPRFFDNRTINLHTLVKDESVLKINGKNYLLNGGAISIDRDSSSYYFIDEPFRFQNIPYDIDIVITHTLDYAITGKNSEFVKYFRPGDYCLEDDLLDENRVLEDYRTRLLEENKIKNWYYGHHHMSRTIYLGDTNFTCLNIDEAKEVW